MKTYAPIRGFNALRPRPYYALTRAALGYPKRYARRGPRPLVAAYPIRGLRLVAYARAVRAKRLALRLAALGGYFKAGGR